MDAIRRLVNTSDLKFHRLDTLEPGSVLPVDYDVVADILLIRFGEQPAETVVHYIDDYMGLLYDAGTFEVVGLQIEAFQYSYVSTHGLTRTWELSDTEQSDLKSTADVVATSERKKRTVAAEIMRPVLKAHKQQRLVPA